MNNIIILDTETISLEKSFIYDLGYIVFDLDSGKTIKEKDYIISQIWNNKPLMATAYYASKKPIYEERLKSGYSKKVGWGNACKFLLNDIKKYNVEKVYAHNSSFDYRAFKLTSNLFNNKNVLDLVEVCDIRKCIKGITKSADYISFCKSNNFMTHHKKPRPRETAEILFKYLTVNVGYEEEHTALEDSKIELQILIKGLNLM